MPRHKMLHWKHLFVKVFDRLWVCWRTANPSFLFVLRENMQVYLHKRVSPAKGVELFVKSNSL